MTSALKGKLRLGLAEWLRTDQLKGMGPEFKVRFLLSALLTLGQRLVGAVALNFSP